MNSFYKQMNAVLFCAAVATTAPVYSMENEVVNPEQQTDIVPAVWYKKRSVQAAGVAMVAAGYMLALRMGKIAAPAFVATLVLAKCADENVVLADDQYNNSRQSTEQLSKNTVHNTGVVIETTQVDVTETPLCDNVWNTKLNNVKKTFADVVAKYLNHERTEEAFDKINDDLNQ